MAYYVYILYSWSLGFFYAGQTNNLDDRLRRHNNGMENFTRRGAPWVLVWCVRKETRGEAMTLEKKLKNLSGQRLVQFISKYEQQVVATDELRRIKQLYGFAT